LVTPSPNLMHQRIVAALHLRLAPYVSQLRLGEVYFSPSDIYLAPELVLQPDIYVRPAVDGRRVATTVTVRSVLLAIEILSPGSARFDRVQKRRIEPSLGTGF